MEEFQKDFSQTTFNHHFQARNAKISPIFHFDRGHNSRICHILCVKKLEERSAIPFLCSKLFIVKCQEGEAKQNGLNANAKIIRSQAFFLRLSSQSIFFVSCLYLIVTVEAKICCPGGSDAIQKRFDAISLPRNEIKGLLNA